MRQLKTEDGTLANTTLDYFYIFIEQKGRTYQKHKNRKFVTPASI